MRPAPVLLIAVQSHGHWFGMGDPRGMGAEGMRADAGRSSALTSAIAALEGDQSCVGEIRDMLAGKHTDIMTRLLNNHAEHCQILTASSFAFATSAAL